MKVEPVALEIPGFHRSSPDLSVVSGIYWEDILGQQIIWPLDLLLAENNTPL